MSNGYMNMSDDEFIAHVRSMMFKEPLMNEIVEELLRRLETLDNLLDETQVGDNRQPT